MLRRIRTGLALILTTVFGTGSAAAATIYSQDFESAVLGPEWSGAGSIQSTGGLSGFGLGDYHLKNDGTLATDLSLSGLAPHTSMTVSFDLAIWDSVDSIPGGFPYGDLFQLGSGPTLLINELFGNYSSTAGPGTEIAPLAHYGYSGSWPDSARSVSITFVHTDASAALWFQFPNAQGAPDEAFGIDNVQVETNAVPEPRALAPLAFCALGLVAALRRRAELS
jgi:hypothetical protein